MEELSGGSGTDARALTSTRGLIGFASSTLGFALLIALSARIGLAVPGTPVPATMQTLAVLLAGGLLGPIGGVASVTAYLGAGIAGAPVFASGGGAAYLAGPTGGYLLGLVPAAWIAGHFARRSTRLIALFPGFLLAVLVIHLSGWAQLSALAGLGPAASMGVIPFLAFDALKALVAAGLVRQYRGPVPREAESGAPENEERPR